ncbi:F-box protein CPR1, partial [Bienertia sinuspersici]
MAPLMPLNHNIPLDVMYNILSNLPAKTLLRFKCICKDWYNLINDPVFIQLHRIKSFETDSCQNHHHHHHHHHRPFVFTSDDSLYYGDDIDSPSQALVKFNWRDNCSLSEHERIHIIDSSNGLVCLSIVGKTFIICNPLTHTFKLIPYPVEIMSVDDLMLFGMDGFGYDSHDDDYKVVLMKMMQHRETWVYSLKTDSWRKAPTQHQKKFYRHRCAPVCGHGMIHCILQVPECSRMYIYQDGEIDTDNEQPQIARFNLSSEKWEEDDLSCPVTYFSPTHNVKIWIMKEYGVKESWTKLFCVPKSFEIGRPIAYSRTRPEALWLNSNNGRQAGIVCYNMQDETREEYKLSIPKKYSQVQVDLCAQSLFSIPGSSYMKGQTYQADEEDDTIEEEDNTIVSS